MKYACVQAQKTVQPKRCQYKPLAVDDTNLFSPEILQPEVQASVEPIGTKLAVLSADRLAKQGAHTSLQEAN